MSTTVEVKGNDGVATASVELPAEVFDTQASIPLLHQVVVAQQAAARQGTHKTKTRGEVAGGGKKPYKQKGTGRARQGSIRAPQFTGGGVVHGPVPRDYTQRVNKKMKVAALRGALSDRARAGVLHVIESFVDGETPRTKDALAALNAVTEAKKVLVVLAAEDEVNWISLRNLPHVHLLEAGQLNTYDVLYADAVVFTSAALDEFLGTPLARTEIERPAKADEDEPKADKKSPKGKGVTKAKPAEDDSADEADADSEGKAE
ncbi:50S ribosomal protein L4 [Virgisporangium aliadipatigenens]|uniref:Large ribosomal subunit protein uL4 n=1 Tax=Virgisporangium aliadipatigenens TaxID=741659 RepID=A0A8J3YI08_9ACTN|nr:50S ribosomal protein L4 [Virgisporangium aliadipatigenens]